MMKKINRLIVGASIVASMSAIAPAQAAAIQNATITGNAPYLTYDADATTTFLVPNSANNVQKVLGGDSSSPTGNVELFSNSETLSNSQFASYGASTSLAGTIGGKAITLSSLTFADWNTNLGSGKTLAQQWFGDLLAAYNLTSLVTPTIANSILGLFTQAGGLQRFSDPNISYVNQDADGWIRIGMAGHLDARSFLTPNQQALLQTLNPKNLPIQASELVKVSYNNGPAQYLYSFKATNSGLVNREDRASHNGNYEVKLQGDKPSQSVPEPSAVIGLVSLGGLLAAKRKLMKPTSVS